MDPPKVKNVMVAFDLNRGCFIIALIGFFIAILTIIMIILYDLIESTLDLVRGDKNDNSASNAIVVIVLVNSIMLVIACSYLTVAYYSKKSAAFELSAYFLFVMVTIDIVIVVMGPFLCFFTESACGPIKKSSYILQWVVLLGMMIHMDLWSYYMTCIFNTALIKK